MKWTRVEGGYQSGEYMIRRDELRKGWKWNLTGPDTKMWAPTLTRAKADAERRDQDVHVKDLATGDILRAKTAYSLIPCRVLDADQVDRRISLDGSDDDEIARGNQLMRTVAARRQRVV